MKCAECNSLIPDDSRFCPRCGAKVAAVVKAAAEASSGGDPLPAAGAADLEAAPAPTVRAEAVSPAAASADPVPIAAANAGPARSGPSGTDRVSAGAGVRPGQAGTSSKLVGIIAAAVLGVIVLGGGGYFAWREFAPSADVVAPPQPTPPAPIASNPPVVNPPVVPPPAPALPPAPAPTAAGNPIDLYLAQRVCKDANCTCASYKLGDPSPLTGSGPVFEADGGTYRLDARLIVAISGQETNFGFRTACKVTHNAWNWFWCYASKTGCSNNPVLNSPFASWQEGIDTVSKFMRKSYLQKGYVTVAQIQTKYCTSGCQDWTHGVTAFLNDLGGDPSHLER
jgi:hypothetical protein